MTVRQLLAALGEADPDTPVMLIVQDQPGSVGWLGSVEADPGAGTVDLHAESALVLPELDPK